MRDFLVRNGVSTGQIQAYGYGEEYPVATNNTEAGRQQNRRVDIVISETRGTATSGVGGTPPAGTSAPSAEPPPTQTERPSVTPPPDYDSGADDDEDTD